MNRSPFLALAVAVPLALVGCSSTDSQSEPVTITSTVNESPSESTTDETTAESTESEQPSESTDAASSESPSSEPSSPAPPPPSTNHNINAGQVGGNCGTTAQGDSITAGAATSCEFAAAIFDAAMAASYTVSASNPTVTALPRTDITAYSPVTGQSYSLHCYIGSAHDTLTCQEGNNADVRAVFSSSPGSLGSRVNIVG